jgi:hypothetical protein
MKSVFLGFGKRLKSLQWRQCVAACCMAVILLTANVGEARQNYRGQAQGGGIPPTEEVGRPRTMDQWQAEREALEGQPGKRMKRIAEESADAIENMGEIYPQNVKTLIPGVDNGELPTDD